MAIELDAVIDENGDLRARVPAGTPPGKTKIWWPQPAQKPEHISKERPWTDAEIKAMLVSHPKSGAEIAQSDAIGGWEHLGITDSVAYIEKIRRQRKDRQWRQE